MFLSVSHLFLSVAVTHGLLPSSFQELSIGTRAASALSSTSNVTTIIQHKVILFCHPIFSSWFDMCPSRNTSFSCCSCWSGYLRVCSFRHSHHSYDEVAREVLAESEITAGDEFRKAAIGFFDNKFGSLVPLKAQFFVE